jgi:mycothiol synthase
MKLDMNSFPIRSFSPDQDIPRLLSLYSSVEAVDQTGIDITEQELRAQINLLGGHDPVQDRWIIEDPTGSNTLVASALIRLPPETQVANANIIVHPDWRGRGIGSVLLSRLVERAYQLKAGSIQCYADFKQRSAPLFLKKHGFILLGSYTEFRIDAELRFPPVIWPFGYTMRSYAQVQDLSILTQAMNLSYIPLWGHHEVSEAEMAAWLPGFNEEGLFLVFSEKGRVVGISRTEPSIERTKKNGLPTGYMDAPGIVPQHRRLDLYRALVLTGIKWLRDKGHALVEMESWGDKLEVLKMYRELGFKDLRQLDCYELKIVESMILGQATSPE